MKHLLKTAAAAILATAAIAGSASAQSWNHGRHDNGNHRGWDHNRGRDHDRRWDNHSRYRDSYRGWNGGYSHDYYRTPRYNGWHDRSDWRRGGYVSRYDYNRGYVVDYRYHRGLYRPPYGYEWRRVDNNYVLVALATGLIAAFISGY